VSWGEVALVRLVIIGGMLLLSCGMASAAVGAPSDCARYGLAFKGLLETGACFDINSYVRTELVINDPDNPEEITDGAELNARFRSDIKIIRETEIGTLGAFVRLQADYDPGIFDDLIAGVTRDDFALGLDAFEISVHRPQSVLRIGKIENAAAAFLADGFTDRGAESLDARSGLGISYQRRIFGNEVRVSLSDPRESSDATPISPNFGIGVARQIGPILLGFGAAALNVDDISPLSPPLAAPRLTGPLRVARQATFGYGFGLDVQYTRDTLKAFIGATYAKNAANDVVFSFSDGFDAVTIYGGVSKIITPRLIFNADISYVSAVEAGLRDLNGVEAAINLTWRLPREWQLLGEIGFDSVDDFGAGKGFFFNREGREMIDFLFQVRHDF